VIIPNSVRDVTDTKALSVVGHATELIPWLNQSQLINNQGLMVNR
jgi:hypothetical protein